MDRCNCARCASTLCLIDFLITINSITLSICSTRCPWNLCFLSIEINTSDMIDLIKIILKQICIIKCAEDLTNLIFGAETRSIDSTCRRFNNSAVCLDNTSSIHLLDNTTFCEFTILVESKFLNVINLTIQCISNIEFWHNVRRQFKFLTSRCWDSRCLRSKDFNISRQSNCCWNHSRNSIRHVKNLQTARTFFPITNSTVGYSLDINVEVFTE